MCKACLAETLPEGQFSVSVISSSGKPVEAAQIYLATKAGLFQQGAADKDGLFIFKTPAKSAFLFAAAPGFEEDKITYNGQKSVSFTMQESTTRNSAIGNPALTLVGKVGTIYVYPTHISCSGIAFPETDTHNTTAYSPNGPVIAVDADGRKFKIYVKAIAFPISLVEYTH